MAATGSPFPKLSQVWRLARLAGATFGMTALTGFTHLAWSQRTAAAAVAVGAAEAAWRQAYPSGKLSGWLAEILAAIRMVRATTTAPKVDSATAKPTPALEATSPAEPATTPAGPPAAG
jgi:hypothetical protein